MYIIHVREELWLQILRQKLKVIKGQKLTGIERKVGGTGDDIFS